MNLHFPFFHLHLWIYTTIFLPFGPDPLGKTILYHTWSLIRCSTMSDTVVEGLVLLRIVWFTAAKVLCMFLTNRTAKLSSWLKNASTGLLSPFLLVGNSDRLTPLFKAFHRSRMGWISKCQSPLICNFVPMRPMLTPLSVYILCIVFYVVLTNYYT